MQTKLFVIDAGSDQNGVSVAGAVDRLLDPCMVSRNVDCPCPALVPTVVDEFLSRHNRIQPSGNKQPGHEQDRRGRNSHDRAAPHVQVVDRSNRRAVLFYGSTITFRRDTAFGERKTR